jgi:mono/diheme cytochrome c family protein
VQRSGPIVPYGGLLSNNVRGRIWRVAYQGGNLDAAVAAAPAPMGEPTATSSAEARPLEGMHPDTGRGMGVLPMPKGLTNERAALGNRVFHGKVADGTCGGCHGADGKGSPVAPDLTAGKWLWSDGSLRRLETMIRNGVPESKAHPGAMPPIAVSSFLQADLDAVRLCSGARP